MQTILKKIAKSERFIDELIYIIKNENENLSIDKFVKKYRDMFDSYHLVEWIIDDKYISEKNQRLFAVLCAKKALELARNTSEVIGVLEVAERFANGEATKEEMKAANKRARNANYGYKYKENDDEFNIIYADVVLYIRGAVMAATDPYPYSENSFCDEAISALENCADAYDTNYYMINGHYDHSGETIDKINNELIDKLLTYFE
jgi:transcription antitermination factor NusG